MANKPRKSEHCGAKKGQGGYWGPKADAKKGSNRNRREEDKSSIMDETDYETGMFI